MTVEEAIRILDPETTAEALAEIEYYAGFSGHTAKVQACSEACEIAVAAIEKQMPKKPYFRKEEDAKGYACPVCDMGVTADHGRIRDTFCSHCGQAIDWGEDDG